MNTHAHQSKENKNQSVVSKNNSKQKSGESNSQFADNRPESVAQRQLNEMANSGPGAKQAAQLKSITGSNSNVSVQLRGIEEEELLQGKFETVQKKDPEVTENNTGLPDQLKSGIENLSGVSIDDVNVHYNSDKPAQLQAHAYAQGTDIHVAPGQEKHLPHEAWHVVQQKQGRVKPTMQMKGKVKVNDDKGLEKEADVMGSKAIVQAKSISGSGVAQLGRKKRDIKRAKQNNPNGVQHHIRPEYQAQNEQQMNLVMGGMDRKEAKRATKQKVKKR